MGADLHAYGWDEDFEKAFADLDLEGTLPGRVVLVLRGALSVHTAIGRLEAVTARRLLQRGSGLENPAIGDWVALEPPASGGSGRIVATLPRRTKLARKVAGNRSDEQVVAANVDTVLVVMGLDGDFNPRRLDRYLVMVRAGGVEPVVVLNKADLTDEAETLRRRLELELNNTPVVAVSAEHGDLADLEPWLTPAKTVALVGSSGAGKSTLTNALLGEERMRTGEVRAGDQRGTHTTTHRELIRLPGGALLIDNPGIREVQPWEASGGLEETFEDIDDLALDCRFNDCSHTSEPGCAVLAAIEDGTLDAKRLEHRRELEREAAALEQRRSVREKREADKKLGKLYKQVQRNNRKRPR